MPAFCRFGARALGALTQSLACGESSMIASSHIYTSLRFASSASHQEPYDVVIVGAGMVGAAVAALLRNQPMTSGLRIALLDVKPQTFEYGYPAVPALRVSTVTPASIYCLQQAGAWETLQPPRSAAFTNMQVWDVDGPGHISWSAADVGMEHMGVVMENDAMQAALLAAARRGLPSANTTSSSNSNSKNTSTSSASGGGSTMDFIWPAQVVSLTLPPLRPANGSATSTPGSSAASGPSSSSSHGAGPSGRGVGGLAELALQDGRVLRSRLVVAADGAASKIRSMAGLRAPITPYNQRGVVATVAFQHLTYPSDASSSRTDGSASQHQGAAGGPAGATGSATSLPGTMTAWQRFLPTGPLALLPLRGGYASIVWSTHPAMAADLEKMSPEEFGNAVNRALCEPGSGASGGGPLSGMVRGLPGPALELPPLVSGWAGNPPRSFPLQTRHAGSYVLPRLALVGDAAHAVHPLAGQGVNLGLGDAQALAQALSGAIEAGGDVGDLRMLRADYEAPRRRANGAMMTAMASIKAAFAANEGFGNVWPLMRGFGLSALNASGPLKNEIMRFAMGFSK